MVNRGEPGLTPIRPRKHGAEIGPLGEYFAFHVKYSGGNYFRVSGYNANFCVTPYIPHALPATLT